MAESRWLSRMPVYDIARGRVVGRVHRVLFDANARKVVGLLLATRLGREPRCLPFRHVHAIGEHAVTVRGTDAIAPLSQLPDMEEALRSQRRIYNSPILTEGGVFVGDVDEFTVNPESGRLETLLVSGGLIRDLFRGQAALPSHLVVAIGEDATIVKDVAVTYLKERRQAQKEKNGSASAREEREPAPFTWRERLRRALTVRRGQTGDSERRPASDEAGRLRVVGTEERPNAADRPEKELPGRERAFRSSEEPALPEQTDETKARTSEPEEPVVADASGPAASSGEAAADGAKAGGPDMRAVQNLSPTSELRAAPEASRSSSAAET